MDIERKEEVTLWPHTRPTKTTLDTYMGTDPDTDVFAIDMSGDHLPEGVDGHIDSFYCKVRLNDEEAMELYQELHLWLTGRGVHFSPINLKLKLWDQRWDDPYDHEALAANFEKIDAHDGTTDGRGRNTQDGSS